MKVTLPVDPVYITQGFGVNKQNYAKFGLSGHNGWDFRTKYPDTPEGKRNLFATLDCTFHKIGDEGNQGYGKYTEHITVAGSRRFKHTYAHCDNTPQFTTKKQGESVAISDNTGNSTAAHTHWTVKEIDNNGKIINYNNGYFGAINPQDYLDYVRSLPESTESNMDDKKLADEFRKIIQHNGSYTTSDAVLGAISLRDKAIETCEKEITTLKNQLGGKDSAITTAQRERDTALAEVQNRKDEVDRVREELLKSNASSDALLRQVKSQQDMLDQQGRVIGGLQQDIAQKDTTIRELKKGIITSIKFGELLIALIKKPFTIKL